MADIWRCPTVGGPLKPKTSACFFQRALSGAIFNHLPNIYKHIQTLILVVERELTLIGTLMSVDFWPIYGDAQQSLGR